MDILVSYLELHSLIKSNLQRKIQFLPIFWNAKTFENVWFTRIRQNREIVQIEDFIAGWSNLIWSKYNFFLFSLFFAVNRFGNNSVVLLLLIKTRRIEKEKLQYMPIREKETMISNF